MKIKLILNLITALALIHAAGCMSLPKTTKPVFRSSDFLSRQPASIAVMPIQDARLSKEKEADLVKLGEAVSKTLKKYGYDVVVSGQAEEALASASGTNEEASKAQAQKLGTQLNCDTWIRREFQNFFSKMAANRSWGRDFAQQSQVSSSHWVQSSSGFNL